MSAAFEEFLFQHDAITLGQPVTHTSMIGGQTTDTKYRNSGTYHIEDNTELRDLILALPATHRHGLSQYLPDRFAFFVDLDMGTFKPPRPTIEPLMEWGLSVARQLQNIVATYIVGEPKLVVVVSIIAARKVAKGFKPGIHLHMPDLTVTRPIAFALTSALASELVFSTNLNFPCTDKTKVVDVNLFASEKPALRMFNATKMMDNLTRYKIKAILRADGSTLINPTLEPGDEYSLTQIDPLDSALEAQLKEGIATGVKRDAVGDLEEEPAAKRVILEDVHLVEPERDNSLDTLIRDKIAQHFSQARVSQITRKNGTVWLAKLTSNYCWIKGSAHDSASAFLTITKNGIQPGCQSTICAEISTKPPRVPCFNLSEQRQFSDLAGPILAEDPIAQEAVDEYNGRFAFVMLGENNCNLAVIERNYLDPVTSSPSVRFMNTKVFCEWYRDDRTTDGRVKCELWLKSPRQARYKNVVFMPGVNTEVNSLFNLWQGFPYSQWQEWLPAGQQPLGFYQQDPDLADVMDFLLKTISADSIDTLHYVLNWLAFAVQHPDLPSEVSLALRGQRGIGKTFFGKIAARLFGIHGKVIESRQLSADFNGVLKNTILMVADEASGQYDPDVMVRLQHITTSEYLDINIKNVEKFRVKNCLHIILCSNFERMVAAGQDDRRYCVLDVAAVHPKDAVYFAALEAHLTPVFFSKFLTMLSTRNIQGWLRTEWPLAAQRPLWENKQVSLSPTEHWFYEKIRNCAEEQDWRQLLSKELVSKEVAEFEVKRNQVPRAMLIEQGLNKILQPHRVCSSESGQGFAKVPVGGKKVPAYRFPSLEVCRRAFSIHVETNPVILWEG
jgi:hypothetical protein